MRVSTRLFQELGVNAILERQNALSKTQQQLSTGQRILTLADDPVAATLTLGIKESIEMTEQYQTNGTIAENRLGLEEATLEGVVNLLQRVRELAVQGNNDTLNAQDRTTMALEVRERLDELLGLANTKDANGEYLFAGFQGRTQPFTQPAPGVFAYSGDQGQRSLQIGPDRQVAVGDSGFDVFVDIPADSGGKQDIFTTLYTFAVDLEANNPSGVTLSDIDLAMDNILNVRARIGARQNVIDSRRDVNEGGLLQLRSTLSGIEDLDYAEAISRFNLELVGLEAAQQAYVRVQGLSLFNFLN